MHKEEICMWADKHSFGIYCSEDYDGNEFEFLVAWVAWKIGRHDSVPTSISVTQQEFDSIISGYFKQMRHPGWNTNIIIIFGHKIALRIEDNLSE